MWLNDSVVNLLHFILSGHVYQTLDLFNKAKGDIFVVYWLGLHNLKEKDPYEEFIGTKKCRSSFHNDLFCFWLVRTS